MHRYTLINKFSFRDITFDTINVFLRLAADIKKIFTLLSVHNASLSEKRQIVINIKCKQVLLRIYITYVKTSTER